MKFIDTHTHLFSEQFDEDRNLTVTRAIEAGVDKMFLPNIDLDSIQPMLDLCKAFPKNCYPMIGIHPCSVTENWEQDMAVVEEQLNKNNYCAIGEIGIDLYWDKSTKEIQVKAFEKQVELAKRYQLPIAIHVREAFDETLAIMDRINDDNLSGVFHCFTGTVAQAKHIINYGNFKLGMGGVLTFKNSGLDKVIKEIDMRHLILETDAPYLAPTPYRGKRNQSEYIPLIAEKLAEIKEISIEEVAEVTTANALALFHTVK
jgi:TatD DNase family protein